MKPFDRMTPDNQILWQFSETLFAPGVPKFYAKMVYSKYDDDYYDIEEVKNIGGVFCSMPHLSGYETEEEVKEALQAIANDYNLEETR